MPVTVDLSDYYCAGYRLIKPIPRRVDMSEELFPQTIISDSNCICVMFPDVWCMEWSSSQEWLSEKAHEIGIIESEIKNVFAWSNEAADSYDWPGLFYALNSSKTARAQFFSHDSDITTIGVGLHKSLFGKFISASMPPPAKPGFSPDGECAYSIIAKRKEPLTNGGHVLGFELRNLRMLSLRCSWLCNGLQKDLVEKFDTIPNEYGFISDFDVANKFCEEINSGNIPAEPGLWLPWLMVRYD